MTNYDQPTKNTARRLSLSHAVDLLTQRRDEACCVPENYVSAVREVLLRCENRHDRALASQLDDNTIESWTRLHRSVNGRKTASDLSVCYLCGPDPTSDLETLTGLGVQPQNIWAFELENRHYQEAISTVRNSGFPYLKVQKGKIEQFFEDVPRQFDIVYFDACAPLPSNGQKTLQTLSTLFRHHRLNSPGVLITNFSAPDADDHELRQRFKFLVSAYLYPKAWLEWDGEAEAENIRLLTQEGLAFDKQDDDEETTFSDMVEQNLDSYYSQYITRQIFDLAVSIIPWNRFCSGGFFEKFFAGRNSPDFRSALSIFKEASLDSVVAGLDDEIEDDLDHPMPGLEEPNNNPLFWTLQLLNGRRGHAQEWRQEWASVWKQQSAGRGFNADTVENAIEVIELLRDYDRFDKEGFKKALKGFTRYGKMFNFCDPVSRHTGFELLLNQVAYPMHYNVAQTRRWRYTAKTKEMYLDVIPFDECRYLYDWLPTADLLGKGYADLPHQLAYRFALDGLGKHHHYYHNASSFGGTAVLEFSTPGFGPHSLSPRLLIP
ncbi:hypothetical protein [Novipirellula sp.]|uniref:hypothetical protein n=1 Tax=Novipirellula sp. TaxID=2795430 RepID=UPI0035665A9D